MDLNFTKCRCDTMLVKQPLRKWFYYNVGMPLHQPYSVYPSTNRSAIWKRFHCGQIHRCQLLVRKCKIHCINPWGEMIKGLIHDPKYQRQNLQLGQSIWPDWRILQWTLIHLLIHWLFWYFSASSKFLLRKRTLL